MTVETTATSRTALHHEGFVSRVRGVGVGSVPSGFAGPDHDGSFVVVIQDDPDALVANVARGIDTMAGAEALLLTAANRWVQEGWTLDTRLALCPIGPDLPANVVDLAGRRLKRRRAEAA